MEKYTIMYNCIVEVMLSYIDGSQNAILAIQWKKSLSWPNMDAPMKPWENSGTPRNYARSGVESSFNG